jgi:hypothetical protein
MVLCRGKKAAPVTDEALPFGPEYRRMMDPGETAADGAEGDRKSSQAKGPDQDETP